MARKKKKLDKSFLSNGLNSLDKEIDNRVKRNKDKEEGIQRDIEKKKQEKQDEKFVESMPSFDHLDLKDEE